MCAAKNSHTSIRAGWIPLDYQTSLFSIFPVSLKFLHLSSACFVVVAKSRINNVCVSFSLASLLVTIDWRTLGPVWTSLQHNVGTLTTVKDWPRRHGKTSSPQKVGRERERYDSLLLYWTKLPISCLWLILKGLHIEKEERVALIIWKRSTSLSSGLYKLFHPVIPDGRTWSRLGEHWVHRVHGEHGKDGKHQPDD